MKLVRKEKQVMVHVTFVKAGVARKTGFTKDNNFLHNFTILKIPHMKD